MKIPDYAWSDEMTHYGFFRNFIVLVAQLRSRFSFIVTTPTRQPIVPFDLGDVARAFAGSFASRFAHLEDQSDD